jgi:hypothetical protein
LIYLSADLDHLADDHGIAVLDDHLAVHLCILTSLLGYDEVAGENININAAGIVVYYKPAT